jgi:hypothetical protein
MECTSRGPQGSARSRLGRCTRRPGQESPELRRSPRGMEYTFRSPPAWPRWPRRRCRRQPDRSSARSRPPDCKRPRVDNLRRRGGRPGEWNVRAGVRGRRRAGPGAAIGAGRVGRRRARARQTVSAGRVDEVGSGASLIIITSRGAVRIKRHYHRRGIARPRADVGRVGQSKCRRSGAARSEDKRGELARDRSRSPRQQVDARRFRGEPGETCAVGQCAGAARQLDRETV